MFRRYWLSRLVNSWNPPARRARAQTRSGVAGEVLEERKYLSASMSLADRGHTLVIQGDRSDNRIAITQDNSGVRVVADDVARSFTGITKIVVDTGAGNDTVNFGAAVDPNIQPAELRVRLGAGNDTFDGNISWHTPPADFPPGPCRIDVSGDAGDDMINTTLGSAPTSISAAGAGAIDLQLDGGAGNDIVQNSLHHLHLNGQVNLDLNGGAGDDRVVQTFDNHILANAGLDLNVNGGQGEDDLSLLATSRGPSEAAFDPAFIANSAVSMRLEGGGGSDRFHADITPCVLPQGTLDILFAGGRGFDVFDINVTMEPRSKNPTSTEPYGPMSLKVLGGSGDDQLTLRVANLENSISPLDIKLVGGRGRDTAEVTPGIAVDHWVGGGLSENHNQTFVRDV